MLTILIEKELARALRRMPANAAHLILSKIEQYAAEPETLANNVKVLRGRPEYRLRVGDWRVIFSVENGMMRVLEIGPRGSVYD